MIRKGSKEEIGTTVVVCAISDVFIGDTLVSRSGVRFSFTSLLQRDATLVVRFDANLSSTSFLRRDTTSVVRPDANFSSTSFFRRDTTSYSSYKEMLHRS